MERLDFYNRFKDEISTDWTLDLYTGVNIGQDGCLSSQTYSFSSNYTEGLYAGYCLALNQSKAMIESEK